MRGTSPNIAVAALPVFVRGGTVEIDLVGIVGDQLSLSAAVDSRLETEKVLNTS